MSWVNRWVVDSCACRGVINASRQPIRSVEKVFMSKKEGSGIKGLR